ncbi:MAG: GNAT family N-acetyltransferase [Polymorphobacter sp.]
MLIPATDHDFAALIAGTAPRGYRVSLAGIESPDTLTMLRALARDIAASFSPAAWLVVEHGEIAAMVSIVAPPAAGVVTIGYGVATDRRGRGIARRAIGDIVTWAASDLRVSALAAATAADNPASQRVLAANGFVQTGTGVDPDDGPLLLWQHSLADAPRGG